MLPPLFALSSPLCTLSYCFLGIVLFVGVKVLLFVGVSVWVLVWVLGGLFVWVLGGDLGLAGLRCVLFGRRSRARWGEGVGLVGGLGLSGVGLGVKVRGLRVKVRGLRPPRSQPERD
jgi:hypothetical protein